MPKTIHNSRPCSCCHRLMPIAKAGKRKTCSERCTKAARAENYRQGVLRRMDTKAERSVYAPMLARRSA